MTVRAAAAFRPVGPGRPCEYLVDFLGVDDSPWAELYSQIAHKQLSTLLRTSHTSSRRLTACVGHSRCNSSRSALSSPSAYLLPRLFIKPRADSFSMCNISP